MPFFSIDHWGAWAPEIQDEGAWKIWAQAPYNPPQGDTPKLTFLPAMQRRRLSPMARMVFECAWPIAENHAPMAVVYASRHGETTRDFELLTTLAQGEALSPTSFGLSVHNAIIGQWSVIRQETVESVAISVEGDSAEHALLEACTLLEQGHDQVLVILAEELPPPAWLPWLTDAPFSYVLALRVGRGNDWQLTLSTVEKTGIPESNQPSPLRLLQQLALDANHWQTHFHGRTWTWARAH
ncbi:beta-ketoacyl synthase chain length factor [Azonexus sp.]|jgi:hypothetical protein|uniref:beta-ketoacyl synthase chain length factor n=1 Tax=Azonexus sp. TaxID=1872668 RepID=UPI0028358C14|nr:beta-ketoacyl synthase chain length factor [Azonexus sp.]MDR1994340.1 beta-ketoacyl synthase chain length factor [Azonexus sp.]